MSKTPFLRPQGQPIFYPINHFSSKWRVKYLVFFVVGAASLWLSLCKQNSRVFFSAFLEFPPNFCQTRLCAELCIFLVDFNFDMLLTMLDVFQCFSFFVFHFLLGGYLTKRVTKRVFVY